MTRQHSGPNGISGRTIRLAAFFLTAEIERRQAEQLPVPAALIETQSALLSAAGQTSPHRAESDETLMSTTEFADIAGVTDRTIRRWCAKRNTPKVGGRYVIQETP